MIFNGTFVSYHSFTIGSIKILSIVGHWSRGAFAWHIKSICSEVIVTENTPSPHVCKVYSAVNLSYKKKQYYVSSAYLSQVEFAKGNAKVCLEVKLTFYNLHMKPNSTKQSISLSGEEECLAYFVSPDMTSRDER